MSAEMVSNFDNMNSQRALIFQGGGALGAYEAGVFKALYRKMFDEDKKEPLFDIVAGASIGAVNAVILVNYVLRNGWKGADKALEDFWMHDIGDDKIWLDYFVETPWTGFLWNSFWEVGNKAREIWNYYQKMWFENSFASSLRESYPGISSYFFWPDNYGPMASAESARRYYSYINTLYLGKNGVLNPGIYQPDMKFGDPVNSGFIRFDNNPLVDTIKRRLNRDGDGKESVIQTREGQPRLLLVSVDVHNCSTATTFDSYPINSGKCELCDSDGESNLKEHLRLTHNLDFSDESEIHCSVYGSEHKSVIFYNGVTIDHLLSSMSTHQRYEFPKFKVWVDRDKQEEHQFWDGAYLSNTPLREVIQSHSQYWKNKKDKLKEDEKQSNEIPNLEVYIVNLYPTTEKNFPKEDADADTIKDREIDIKFHDRTTYDVTVANQTTDYIDLTRGLYDLLNESIALLSKSDGSDKNVEKLKDRMNELLGKETKTTKRSGEHRKYIELMKNRFEITKTVYIQRSDDGNTIYGKAFEFSKETLNNLFQQGYNDAASQLKSK